jgi:DNA primase
VAGISDEKLQELRDRVDVVAVVQRRVPLTKSGRDFKGLCPFHGEKTPSFYVVPDKRIFHCFGCGATGDAIKFVMQLDGKGFREAIESLAAEVGLELAPQDPAEARRAARRAALAEVNEKACKFYERVLWEHPLGKPGREHLEQRGVSVETAKAWRLGYAPARWDALARSLERDKVDPQLSDEAGLLVPRKKGPGSYDRFRGRLMIPIREGGRAVAFGGRLLEGESEAKYMNSPESPLYTKGQVLFALDKAREAIRREGVAAFVEGYFDAIGLHQAGVQTAVATCGTALTAHHLELVQRAQAKELVFVFDGDAAGRRAAQRAAELAAAAQISARVLVPPDGEDPDETVRRIGTDAFRGLLRAAQPALEFLLDVALAELRPGASIEERVRVVEHVRGIVQAAPKGLARELYVEKVAEKLGAPVDVIRMAFDAAPAAPAQQKTGPQASGLRPQAKGDGQQRAGQQPRAQSPEPRAQSQKTPSKPAAEGLPTIVGQIELQIAAQMLLAPELCRAVESAGEVSRFIDARLREVAERMIEKTAQGLLDSELLVASIEDDALRRSLSKARDEALKGRFASLQEDLRALQKKLQKHQQLAERFAVRKRAREPKVPPEPPDRGR